MTEDHTGRVPEFPAENEGGESSPQTAKEEVKRPHTPTKGILKHHPPSKKTVVIGVDDTPASEYTVNWYLENFHREGHVVILVHTVEIPHYHGGYQQMYSSPQMWDSTMKRVKEQTQHLERKILSKLELHQIECKFIARGEKPGEAIVTVSEEEGADIIFVGTRGLGKIRRILMGSVSTYVMHHAHCPVLVCRAKDHERAKQDDQESSDSENGADSDPFD